jgi:nicotinic acid phosphoribosyltransferase
MKTSKQAMPGARAILTDLYQLPMAYGYWKSGKADQEAVFHLLFRKQPFQGGFTLCCGLADSIEYLRRFKFEPSDLEHLGQLKGNDHKRLFEPAFLKYLGRLKLRGCGRGAGRNRRFSARAVAAGVRAYFAGATG